MSDNTGIVIRNTGAHYVVRLDESRSEVKCKMAGSYRIRGIRITNPVAVGDEVSITPASTGEIALIKDIKPRRNYIIRKASNLSKEAHIIASNIDRAMLVATLAHPTTATTFIDRFLATAQAYDVPAILVINKIDILADDPDNAELLDAVTHLYRSIGYTVVAVSAATGEGFDTLRQELASKVTLLSGNSGVGKSSIINRLIPGLNLRTAAISDAHDTGMHTTTFSEMYDLDGGGAIIDTPGIRGFGTIDFDRNEVAHFFPEIFELSKECRFRNCTHTHEPGCAVLEALADCRIAQSRYASYMSILDDADQEKYRKGY